MDHWEKLQSRFAKIMAQGQTLFPSVIGQLKLLTSSQAYEERDGEERIESHYVLVPFRLGEPGFALYTMRTIHGDSDRLSDFPIRHVFHFAKPEHREHLEDLICSAQLEGACSEERSAIENRLDLLAQEIDRKSDSLTGGLLIIGGTIVLFNPLAGGLVLLSSLAPVFGGSALNQGIQAASERLHSLRKQREKKLMETSSRREVKRLKPKVVVNPLLGLAADTFHPEQSDFDPITDPRAVPEGVESVLAFRVAARAITDVYQPYLERKRRWKEAGLDRRSVEWIRSLGEV